MCAISQTAVDIDAIHICTSMRYIRCGHAAGARLLVAAVYYSKNTCPQTVQLLIEKLTARSAAQLNLEVR
jgi:hypothetical protein